MSSVESLSFDNLNHHDDAMITTVTVTTVTTVVIQ